MVNFWNIFGLNGDVCRFVDLCLFVVLGAIVYAVDYFGKKNAKDKIANES